MRISGFVLAAAGVLTSVFAAIVTSMVSGLEGSYHIISGEAIRILAISAWGSSLLAAIGAVLVWRHPLSAAVCLAVAAAWLLLSVHYVGIPAGICLVASAVLAILAWRRSRHTADARSSV